MIMIDPQLPLIDLHRHLDGNVRLQTILDLGQQHNLPLPAWDLEGLRPHVQVAEAQPGIMAFIAKFEWMLGVLVDYEACRRVAYENVADASIFGIETGISARPYSWLELGGDYTYLSTEDINVLCETITWRLINYLRGA